MKMSRVILNGISHGAFVGATGDRTRLTEMRRVLVSTQEKRQHLVHQAAQMNKASSTSK